MNLRLCALAWLALACSSRPSAPIAKAPRHLLVGISDGWDSIDVTLSLWTGDSGEWQPVGRPWRGVLGEKGSAWGDGLHGSGAPAGEDGPVKREGDGRSPAGRFALGEVWTRDEPIGRARRIGDGDLCVDDPKSSRYNRIVRRGDGAVDWSSAETMHRSDELYDRVVVVDHNGGGGGRAPVPSGGSCIFLHIWRDVGTGTAGCTAMARADIDALLAQLDASATYVLLPAPIYQRLADRWGLPPVGRVQAAW